MAAAAEGRPSVGRLVKPVFTAAGTIDNLRFVRIVTRGRDRGAGAASVLGTRAIEGRTPARGTDRAARVHPASFPALRIVDGDRSPYPGRRCLPAAHRCWPSRPWMRRVSLRHGSSWATALLLVAVLIYQPAAMFFWVFLAVALVGSVTDSGRALRLARTHFAVAAVAAALAFLGLQDLHLARRT